MANLPEALDAALRAYYPLGGVKSPVTSPRGLAARMTALERVYGSKVAAARAAGIGRSTWGAWQTTKGSHRPPSAANARKLEAAYESLLRQVKVRGARARSAPTKASITATVVADPRSSRYVNRTPHRTFNADRGPNLQGMVNAWADGAPPGEVAAELMQAIADVYDGTMFAFEGDDVSVTLS